MSFDWKIAAITASLAGTAAFAATPPVVARDVAHAIHEKGAVDTVTSLTGKQFDYVTAQAAKGRPEWLRISAALVQATDGARSEAIEGSFSSALQTAPLVVLRLIQADPSRLPIGRVCEDRAIEPTAIQARAYQLRATKALQQVTDPSLRSLRDACIGSLRSASAP